MNEKYKYAKQYWYPHMGPQDVKIWERFIDANPDWFDECIYDLPIGDTLLIEQNDNSGDTSSWQFRNKKRCDVVAFCGDLPTIIEIKPNAGLQSIGQIICYDLLYQEYVDKSARPELMILTDHLLPDMEWLCEEFNIKIIVV